MPDHPDFLPPKGNAVRVVIGVLFGVALAMIGVAALGLGVVVWPL